MTSRNTKKNHAKVPKPIIGIIGGKGKMGSYFAELFHRSGYRILISDRGTRLTNEALARKADIVIISVPIDQTEAVIKKIVHHVKAGSLLMDLTSLKEFPVKEMLKGKSEVIGLHPMFAHTNALPGQTIIACPERSKKWFLWIKQFFEERGAKIVTMNPQEHDRIMAVVQAMVHFADIAFGHALKSLGIPVKEYMEYAGPASELKMAFVGRILNQDPSLYAHIGLQNPFATTVIQQLLKSTDELANIQKKKSVKNFEEYFQFAASGLKRYREESFNDTNYLIQAILEKRQRQGISAETLKLKAARTKGLKRKVDVAVLGPPRTYTDLAAKKYEQQKKSQLSKQYYASIAEVFEAVEKGNAVKGIVPLENSIEGTVRETYDELFQREVLMTEKIYLPIKHALVALPGILAKDIENIASHGQALQQCRKFLKKHYASTGRIVTSSTIAALEKIEHEYDRTTAVIVPQEIALEAGLNILAKNIGDSSNNKTEFVIIQKGSNKKLVQSVVDKKNRQKKDSKGTMETSIAFYFHKDKPGSLYTIFKDFAEAGVNLSRIESRPSHKEVGNYIFYLSFLGSPSEPRSKKVLSEIQKKVAKLKILGVL